MRLHYFALQDLSEPTGATAHVEGAVRGLQANGVEVDVTAVAPPGYPGLGDTFHRLPPFRQQPNLLGQVRALRRTIGEAVTVLRPALAGCDVAYTRHYMAGRIFRRAGCSVPWVFEVNALPAEDRAARGRVTDRLVATRIRTHFQRTVRSAAHIVTVTPELRASVVELYGVAAGRISVVPNGVDTTRFRPSSAARAAQRTRWNIPPDALLLGYVGNCAHWQRFDLLLEALGALRTSFPKVHAVVVGDGPLRSEWETQAHRHGLAQVVQFVGPVSVADSANAFAALDVAVDLVQRGAMDARTGAAGIKVRCALASGIPMVALRLPGMELIETAAAGCVVEPEGSALADALARLLADAPRRAEHGHCGRMYAESHLSWDHVGARLRDICAGVCDERAGHAS